jgi:hypothetical protein
MLYNLEVWKTMRQVVVSLKSLRVAGEAAFSTKVS